MIAKVNLKEFFVQLRPWVHRDEPINHGAWVRMEGASTRDILRQVMNDREMLPLRTLTTWWEVEVLVCDDHRGHPEGRNFRATGYKLVAERKQ